MPDGRFEAIFHLFCAAASGQMSPSRKVRAVDADKAEGRKAPYLVNA